MQPHKDKESIYKQQYYVCIHTACQGKFGNQTAIIRSS